MWRFSKGFENAGFEVALALDCWEDAIETFNHNQKTCWYNKNI